MRLNDLSPGVGARTARKRLGRGIGSGLGKTSGKGHKGQKARAGGSVRPGFEGGQLPLYRRLPKFGFKSRKGDEFAIPLRALASIEGDEVTLESLRAARVIRSKHGSRVRIVVKGELEKVVHVRNVPVSAGARAAIEKLGGTVANTQDA